MGVTDPPPRKPSTAALFVRIPARQARQLDRAAFELKLPKQQLVTHLLERYVDPDSPQSLRALGASEKRPGALTVDASTMTVGHHSFRPAESEVLTAQEVAELLQVELSTVLELSAGGKLPGRELAGQWRFSRAAVLRWLEGGSA
ncbi:MAG TPA: helix-turn-helix domain-containing protein [Solirubrobacteraceae bacterium]|jgi:excisionase family DNA binding protein